MVMKYGSVAIFKMGSSFMHCVRTCCTRIMVFKYGRYSHRSDAFIQPGRFDLLLDNRDNKSCVVN